jgi:hypothetical protein
MTAPPTVPTVVDSADLVRREQARRERAWDPAARWRAIQETITWAEAQATVRRNTPVACVAAEARKRATPSVEVLPPASDD